MRSSLELVKEQIASACINAGRSIDEVSLIAVSKTWPVDHITPVVDEGHLILGENKLQELEEKAPQMNEHIDWHFIGGLQRNKVRKVLTHANWIHSIDNEKLLNAVDRIAGEEGKKPHLFIQVNIDDESTKGGFSPAALPTILDTALNLNHITLEGLMCIPSPQPTAEGSRLSFRKVFELQKGLESSLGVPLPSLSMGMSNDYTVAIEEGATHIRVGSAIFGKRTYLNK